MSQARSPPGRQRTDSRSQADSERSPAAKVVLMELARAGRPLAAEELHEQTLLSPAAVESTLSILVDGGLCAERPGDDRRPAHYEVQLPAATESAD